MSKLFKKVFGLSPYFLRDLFILLVLFGDILLSVVKVRRLA